MNKMLNEAAMRNELTGSAFFQPAPVSEPTDSPPAPPRSFPTELVEETASIEPTSSQVTELDGEQAST